MFFKDWKCLCQEIFSLSISQLPCLSTILFWPLRWSSHFNYSYAWPSPSAIARQPVCRLAERERENVVQDFFISYLFTFPLQLDSPNNNLLQWLNNPVNYHMLEIFSFRSCSILSINNLFLLNFFIHICTCAHGQDFVKCMKVVNICCLFS